MIGRLVSIIFIFLCCTVAWMVLGATIHDRSHTQDSKLRSKVYQLWGTAQSQQVPAFYYFTEKKVESKRYVDGKEIREIDTVKEKNAVPIDSSEISVDLALDHRRKGLLWYSTYGVGFGAEYIVKNETKEVREYFFEFPFPARGAVYDDFVVTIGDDTVKNIKLDNGVATELFIIEPSQTQTIHVSFKSQGLDWWWYDFGNNVSQVKDFRLVMLTDFEDIDFPENSISPTTKRKTSNGWNLEWKYANLLTGVKIGMEMPKKLNPGPWVSQITFFAPVSLLFFFFLLFIFTTIRELTVHPMNYFFLGAAFFSFHLLLGYLVDHISIQAAFFVSAAVSVFLVVSYMRLVVGARVAFVEVALSQLVYLVMFSYAFFFEGYTGLTITILCILTLFIIMQFTGKMNWGVLFSKREGHLANTPPMIKS